MSSNNCAEEQRQRNAAKVDIYMTPEQHAYMASKEYQSAKIGSTQNAVPFRSAKASKTSQNNKHHQKSATIVAPASQYQQNGYQQTGVPVSQAKGKTQLARDYYMMQAFVQQPHLLAGQKLPANIKVLHQTLEGRLVASDSQHSATRKAKQHQSNQKEQLSRLQQLSTPDHHQRQIKSGTNLASTQQAYYMCSQPQVRHGRSNEVAHALLAGHQASTQSKKLTISEPTSHKRSTQSATYGPQGGTPKTPNVANIFRRKWGGASSTKSQKSASSNKSKGPSTVATNQEFKLNFEDFDKEPTRSARQKREKSRPASQSKNLSNKLDQGLSGTIQSNKHERAGPPYLNVASTPQVQHYKTIRSNSSEIRTNHIDFTQLVNNQLQTLSSKKMALPPKTATQQIAASSKQQAMTSQFETQNQARISAHLMPPKPTTQANAAAKGHKKTRKKSKSKSTTRKEQRENGALGIPPSGKNDQNHNVQSQKLLKPVLQNKRLDGDLGQSQSQKFQLKNGQAIKASENQAVKGKKLRILLNTATAPPSNTADKKVKLSHLNNNDSGRGPGTPNRNRNSNATPNEHAIDKNTDQNQRTSHRSPGLKCPPSKSGNNKECHTNAQNKRKHMTPIMQSRDKMPSSQKQSIKTSQNALSSSLGQKGESQADGTPLEYSQSNTCKSYQGQYSYEKANEPEIESSKGQKTSGKAGDEKLRSHRVQRSVMGQHADNTAVATQNLINYGRRNRNRSASNNHKQKIALHGQTQNSASQLTTTQNKDSYTTDQKKKDQSHPTNSKRKKSSNRRGNSAKRAIQTNSNGVPVLEKERGRSPNRGAIVADGERYYSPQISGQIYSAFRLRALKPKKSKISDVRDQHTSLKQHISSISVDRSNKINVNLLTGPDKPSASNPNLKQSHSTSNSLCSNSTPLRGSKGKDQKMYNRQNAAQKQKMLTNIQNQVLAGTRAIQSRRSKNSDQVNNKKQTIANDKKKAKDSSAAIESHQVVDLMKAQLMTTDIRISTRQKSSQDNNNNLALMTSSQSSFKSAQRQQQAASKDEKGEYISVIKARSISSDERLNSKDKRNCDLNQQQQNSTEEDGVNSKDGSPKFLLSLRQLEQLLFSTQKISSQLKKSETTKASSNLATQTIIQNSLKQLKHQNKTQKDQTVRVSKTVANLNEATNQTRNVVSIKKLKQSTQPCIKKIDSKKYKSATATAEKGGDRITDQQFISLQPTSLQVFNAISEQSSAKEAALSQTTFYRSNPASQKNDPKVHDSKLRKKSLDTDQRIKEEQQEYQQHVMQVTARRMQDKISRQQSNLLSLVELQKLRAHRMASHGQLQKQTQSKTTQQTQVKIVPDSEVMKVQNLHESPLKQRITKHKRIESKTYSQKQGVNERISVQSGLSQEAGFQSGPDLEENQNSEKHLSTHQIAQIDTKKINTQNNSSSYQNQTSSNSKVESALYNNELAQSRNSEERKQFSLNQVKRLVVNLSEQQEPVNSPSLNQMNQNPEMRSNYSQARSSNHENSFLDKVHQNFVNSRTSLTPAPQANEERDNQLNTSQKDNSICSLKQPSLRQITSSHHTSRSNNNKRLQHQAASHDIRQSQDPNQSINLSRILLETSMQQSERGGMNHNQNCSKDVIKIKGYNSQVTMAGYQTLNSKQDNKNFSRLRSSDNNTFNYQQNDGMSYQSLTSGKVFSELNPQSNLQTQQDQNENLRSIKRSLTNPGRFSSNNESNSKKSASNNFMVDEVWPTHATNRKRASSITSLSNSTPGSRTLEQLQAQSQLNSLSPLAQNQPMSPVHKQLYFQTQGSQITGSQAAADDPFLRAEKMIQQSPLRNQNQPEEPFVQDQAKDDSFVASEQHLSEEYMSRDESPANNISDADVAARGTSSPKRRRSPKKHLAQETGLAGLNPVQLDNSTSFNNNDVEYEEDISQEQENPVLQQNAAILGDEAQGQGDLEPAPLLLGASNDNQTSQLLQYVYRQQNRDVTGQCDTAAVERMMNRSEQAESSYEEAPYEKSQSEGLSHLIMFQATNANRDSDGEAQEQEQEDEQAQQDPERGQNLLTSINSQAENNSTPPASNQENPALLQSGTASRRALQPNMQSSETENNPSQLAAIEDVLRMTHPANEITGSLDSVDSELFLPFLRKDEGNLRLNPNILPQRHSLDAIQQSSQDFKQKLAQGTTDAETENIDGEKEIGSNIEITLQESRKGLKSASYSPKDKGNMIDEVGESNSQRVLKESQEEIISPDQINLQVVEQNTQGIELEQRTSVQSSALEFEEAVNTEDIAAAAPLNSPDESPAKTADPQPTSTPESIVTKIENQPFDIQNNLNGFEQIDSDEEEDEENVDVNVQALISTQTQQQPTGQKQLFDIDSLNEFKKSTDLASKKVEITNHIFEMLVKEIKENLFPIRYEDDEDEIVEESQVQQPSQTNSLQAKKKRKKRLASKVKKPSVLPKIKEVKDGVPVDMCLRRIQTKALMRKDVASVEQLEFSATISLSASKDEDTGMSYLDQTKSKEQLETSSQFQLIEIKKQQQLDLLHRKVYEYECQKEAQREENVLKQQENNYKGIKTTTEVVDQYLNTLFETLLQSEQEFLDHLATPFSSNPLQELINIQVLAQQARKLPLSGEQQIHPSDTRTSGSINSNDNELENALFGFHQQQQPVLSVEIYLDIERQKEYVLLADSVSDADLSAENEAASEADISQTNEESKQKPAKKENEKKKKKNQSLEENQSMLAEWENIHNKVLFDAVNDALDGFRPYGLRGPPAPWSGQTRALTYRYSQNAREVLMQVRDKVTNLSKTFGGALANSELLREYHIRGPLEEDKLYMLREERLAIMMMQDVEETQHKWDDLEKQEMGSKIDVAELILQQLAEEIAKELGSLGSRQFCTIEEVE